ncbi:MAG: beta-lactamase family protein [Candidatus Heimdallarchaeota archaeon]|nr:beta-lactamase family protein [Candidatus Heimdallarchaeota archaeon]
MSKYDTVTPSSDSGSILISSNPIKQEINSSLELETFLDSVILDQLVEYSVAGVTFSMVKEGSVFFEKGYGYANSFYESPVLANDTLFRIGSISKTFTAIAVLQLVEDGLLELEKDINDYLTAFKIPETYEESITLRHILTHTAGFEEKTFPSIVGSIGAVEPLEVLLSENIPDRVHLPGVITSYSNYGFSLAGYIVQEISGEDFETYVEENILAPIGMNSTTFLQPLPGPLYSRLSAGHDENGNPSYFEYITIPPAGSASSTASDMARFMMTLLNNGSLEGNRILDNSSVEMMFSDQFVTYENLPSIGLGVYEFDLCEQHIIGHGGDTGFFHSRMILLPEYNIGIFASYNSVGGSIARTLLFEEIVKEYYPLPVKDIEPMKGYKSRVRKFTGFYVTTRRVYSDKPTIAERDYLGNSFSITSKDGYLRIENIGSLDFVEVEPNYFMESTGEYYFKLAFILDDNEKVIHFYANFIGPNYAYEKTHPLYSESEFKSVLVAVILILTLISLVFWGIKGSVKVFKKKEKSPTIQRIARWSFLANLVFSGVTLVILTVKLNSDILLESETVTAFKGLLVFPFLFLISVVVTLVFMAFSWSGFKNKERKPYWKLIGRIHYSTLVALSILLIGIFASWHLFGF